MNNKIRELAIRSEFVLWGDESWKNNEVIDWCCSYDNELEKFAKLLTKEILDLVHDEVQYITDHTRATDLCWRVQNQLGIDTNNK